MDNISAIILAAGTSSRMGDDNKLFLDLAGKTIIQHVIENVSQTLVDEIIFVGSELSMSGLKQFEKPNVRLVENPNYETGMTSSIQVGVRTAISTRGIMICLGDMPLIRPETYKLIYKAFDGKSMIVPAYKGKRGNPVIFPVSLREAILNHKEPEGCKGIVKANTDLVKEVEVDDSGILRDVDTPEEYLDISNQILD